MWKEWVSKRNRGGEKKKIHLYEIPYDFLRIRAFDSESGTAIAHPPSDFVIPIT